MTLNYNYENKIMTLNYNYENNIMTLNYNKTNKHLFLCLMEYQPLQVI